MQRNLVCGESNKKGKKHWAGFWKVKDEKKENLSAKWTIKPD